MNIHGGDGNLNARSDGRTVGGSVFIEAGELLVWVSKMMGVL